ncbi:MAG: putative ABC transporter permease [Treponema sp.]|jgi:uncharacterized membrane protein|nr:putative ABC transporter permease [Treponema sp.]
MFDMGPEQLVFAFFFFSFSGWIGETIMESSVRKRFVSKGFFKGPWVPVHGVGAFVVYRAVEMLKTQPLLVFVVGTVLCTVVEYLAALLLEKFFNTKGWDYDTYPFTYWCNFKKRVALTTSLFFGLITLGLVYFYWELAKRLMLFLGTGILVKVDVFFILVFVMDATFTFRQHIKNNAAGIPNKTAGLL